MVVIAGVQMTSGSYRATFPGPPPWSIDFEIQAAGTVLWVEPDRYITWFWCNPMDPFVGEQNDPASGEKWDFPTRGTVNYTCPTCGTTSTGTVTPI